MFVLHTIESEECAAKFLRAFLKRDNYSNLPPSPKKVSFK